MSAEEKELLEEAEHEHHHHHHDDEECDCGCHDHEHEHHHHHHDDDEECDCGCHDEHEHHHHHHHHDEECDCGCHDHEHEHHHHHHDDDEECDCGCHDEHEHHHHHHDDDEECDCGCHDEHEHHHHHHHHDENGENDEEISVIHHDEALAASFKVKADFDYEAIDKIIRGAMMMLCGAVDKRNGVVGHIKAAVMNGEDAVMYSLTYDEVFCVGDPSKCRHIDTVTFAAIVYGLDEDLLYDFEYELRSLIMNA